ncbi:MAG: T9SS C-terminal target domain-containing protein [Flavobacteriales bacterium]|nr:T9SS C-terminal target domain-containing protein [Crocinitomicaceae bacterium]NBX80923.1 T9SS C-terminal target domain-containing protein [Flavobacteriales bacterium]NCA20080.1 T9SS C-terminal target domain-containing protein [Crocinitomicaceae bacterium]
MNKKYILTALLFGFIFMTKIWSQVSITYQVDISNAGLTLNPNGMRIGGNFTDLGVSSLPNWTPSDPSCTMTNIGNGIWTITVNYPCTAIGQTQLFKFVNGNWGSNEGSSELTACGQNDGQGGYNRELIIPQYNTTIALKYNSCKYITNLTPNACSPSNFPNNTIGTIPEEFTNLPNAQYKVPYTFTFSFRVSNNRNYYLADVETLPGINYKVTEGTDIDPITEAWSGMFLGGESGCLTIYGTPQTIGRFNINLVFVMMVETLPVPVYYNFTLDVIPEIANNNGLSFCLNENSTLSTNLGCDLTYQWKNYNTSIFGATTPYFSPAQSGNYTVEVTNLSNNYTLTSQPVSVTVNTLPAVLLSDYNQICDTLGLFTLSGGLPTGGIYSGTSVNNNVFNTSIGTGSYPITYTFTDNNGCSSNAISNLTVIDCSGVGFIELIEDVISIYPNPTDNIFTIEASESFIGQTIAIFDISGRLLFKCNLNETKTPINVSAFATGTYYVNLLESNKMMKLIKQ